MTFSVLYVSNRNMLLINNRYLIILMKFEENLTSVSGKEMLDIGKKLWYHIVTEYTVVILIIFVIISYFSLFSDNTIKLSIRKLLFFEG